MQQKDLLRVRQNKSSKHGINVIAIKGIVYHREGYSAHMQSIGNSPVRGHTLIGNKLYKITYWAQQRYKMQIWMEPHSCIYSFFLVYEAPIALGKWTMHQEILRRGFKDGNRWSRAGRITALVELHFSSILKWEGVEEESTKNKRKKSIGLRFSEQKD